MPHKVDAAHRHHIPPPKRKVTNWAEYDASLRRRDEAIARWKAVPRSTPGGQPSDSDPAITTALMPRAVFRPARRQTAGVIRSVLQLLGLGLPAPDHSALGRRTRTVTLPGTRPCASGALHRLVVSTGLNLYGPGEWLIEKHGTKKRRSWKKVHVGMDAASGRIVAATLSSRDIDDAAQVDLLLDQVTGPVVQHIQAIAGTGCMAATIRGQRSRDGFVVGSRSSDRLGRPNSARVA